MRLKAMYNFYPKINIRSTGWQGSLILAHLLVGLSGCGWIPLSRPEDIGSNLDLIQLEEKSKQRVNSGSHKVIKSHEKQITSRTPSTSSIPPTTSTRQSVAACIQATGIPAETTVAADPTNYGYREKFDDQGKPIKHAPYVIVLHETVASEQETLNLFRTRHDMESDQASYHMVITEDGRRIRTVDDAYRAFGAGNSAMRNNYTIRIKKGSDGSLNNIALHLSLVSPEDGRIDSATHSGYSKRQYASAAAQTLLWQAAYQIPANYITTHKAIDKSNTRKDPRSFDWDAFAAAYRYLAITCGLQSLAIRR